MLQRTVALYPIFQVFLIPILLIGFAVVLYPEPPASAKTKGEEPVPEATLKVSV